MNAGRISSLDGLAQRRREPFALGRGTSRRGPPASASGASSGQSLVWPSSTLLEDGDVRRDRRDARDAAVGQARRRCRELASV